MTDAPLTGTPMFRDQLKTIVGYFQQWSDYEQVLALELLLLKVTPSQLQYLIHVLDPAVIDFSSEVEKQANNPVFINTIWQEFKEVLVHILLTHLPWLRTGNSEAKEQYLNAINKLINHCLKNRGNLPECKRLLHCALCHPAMSSDDKRLLGQWLQHVDEHLILNTCYPSKQTNHDNICQSNSYYSSELLKSTCEENCGRQINSSNPLITQPNGHSQFSHSCTSQKLPLLTSKNQRSNSLTPHSTEGWPSITEDISLLKIKQRSLSLSSEHAPLSPQSSLASSGSSSETQLEENKSSFSSAGSGMRDVPSWLKSLRLHKYSYLFAHITYDEMLNLTEAQLEKQGVTKGARNKIILNITKLRERGTVLQLLDKRLCDGHDLKSVLEELKSIVMTPIKCLPGGPKSPEENIMDFLDKEPCIDDIPSLVLRVLRRAQSRLVSSLGHHDECCRLFLGIVDKCIESDGFSSGHKMVLEDWRNQMKKMTSHVYSRDSSDHYRRRRNASDSSYNQSSSVGNTMGWGGSTSPCQLNFVSKAPGALLGTAGSVYASEGPFLKRSSLQEVQRPFPLIQRTKSDSASIRPFPAITLRSSDDPELSLESLCRSVTEHALGGSGET